MTLELLESPELDYIYFGRIQDFWSIKAQG